MASSWFFSHLDVVLLRVVFVVGLPRLLIKKCGLSILDFLSFNKEREEEEEREREKKRERKRKREREKIGDIFPLSKERERERHDKNDTNDTNDNASSSAFIYTKSCVSKTTALNKSVSRRRRRRRLRRRRRRRRRTTTTTRLFAALLLLLTNTHAHTKKLDDDEDDDDFDDARFSKRHHLLPTVVLVASKATKKGSSSIQSRRRLARDDDDDDERVDVFCRKRRGGDDTRRQRPRDDDDDARQRIVKGVVYGVKGVDKLAIRPVVSKDGAKVAVFPGTHDSGAYFLTNTFQPGKQSPVPDWVKSVSKVAKTVGIPIEELVARWAKRKNKRCLNNCARALLYLDLRCGWQGRGGGGGGGDKQGTWKIHHALVGVDVSIVLEDVANFLRTFTTEVVIVEMSHLLRHPDERAVEQLASEVLGSLGEFVVPYEKDENGDTFWTKPLEDSVKKTREC